MKRTKHKTLPTRSSGPARKKIKTEEEEFDEWQESTFADPEQPQLSLLFKIAPYYENCVSLPYELLMKILSYVIDTSDHPLRDLVNLSQVSESWRMLILKSPSLWSRIDFSEVPLTPGNVRVIKKILKLNPKILNYVREFAIGGSISGKNDKIITFIETITKAPQLDTLTIRRIASSNRCNSPSAIIRSILQCRSLKRLTITQSKTLFNNQKWLSDFLMYSGRDLEVLNIAMSLSTISTQISRAIASDFCPNLKILDMSTCSALITKSLDATVLAENMPNLEVLRLGNVSFKPVHQVPQEFKLKKLEELSMPTPMRDPDRDDALFATLTYGSNRMKTLDLRGSSISASALIDMPSQNLRELHLDDICPSMRQMYSTMFSKWAHSLEVLSIIKINCPDTVKKCLKTFTELGEMVRIREIDLQASEVVLDDLRDFVKASPSLSSINLSSCRSLPRGCKGLYLRNVPKGINTADFNELMAKLKSPEDESENGRPVRRRR